MNTKEKFEKTLLWLRKFKYSFHLSTKGNFLLVFYYLFFFKSNNCDFSQLQCKYRDLNHTMQGGVIRTQFYFLVSLFFELRTQPIDNQQINQNNNF
jgi:hypothetical protein